MKSITRNSGFTLIELLVVITIIVLLSGLLMVSIGGSKMKARDGVRISDVSQLQLAMVMYYERCNRYPVALSLSENTGCPNGTYLSNFISKIPTDPNGSAYGYAYKTNASGVPVNFIIHTTLEAPNAASARGLDAMPSGWTFAAGVTSFTCSNASGSLEFCVTSK